MGIRGGTEYSKLEAWLSLGALFVACAFPAIAGTIYYLITGRIPQ